MISASSAPAPPPNCQAEGPPPPEGGSSPLRLRRPNRSDRRRLKLRHSSSRSGGPWLPPPGPCGPREPRPQLGSFKDIGSLVSMGRLCRRASFGRAGLRELGDCAAQPLQAGAGARADEDARNPTILVSLD